MELILRKVHVIKNVVFQVWRYSIALFSSRIKEVSYYSIDPGGSRNTPALESSYCRILDKLCPDGPLGLYADLPYQPSHHPIYFMITASCPTGIFIWFLTKIIYVKISCLLYMYVPINLPNEQNFVTNCIACFNA